MARKFLPCPVPSPLYKGIIYWIIPEILVLFAILWCLLVEPVLHFVAVQVHRSNLKEEDYNL